MRQFYGQGNVGVYYEESKRNNIYFYGTSLAERPLSDAYLVRQTSGKYDLFLNLYPGAKPEQRGLPLEKALEEAYKNNSQQWQFENIQSELETLPKDVWNSLYEEVESQIDEAAIEDEERYADWYDGSDDHYHLYRIPAFREMMIALAKEKGVL